MPDVGARGGKWEGWSRSNIGLVVIGYTFQNDCFGLFKRRAGRETHQVLYFCPLCVLGIDGSDDRLAGG
jgi:hypothetical protein